MNFTLHGHEARRCAFAIGCDMNGIFSSQMRSCRWLPDTHPYSIRGAQGRLYRPESPKLPSAHPCVWHTTLPVLCRRLPWLSGRLACILRSVVASNCGGSIATKVYPGQQRVRPGRCGLRADALPRTFLLNLFPLSMCWLAASLRATKARWGQRWRAFTNLVDMQMLHRAQIPQFPDSYLT